MPIRRILRIDDPDDHNVLKTRCRSVRLPNASLAQLVEDMFETMLAADGVGLAAPQIGITQRLAVIGIPEEREGADSFMHRFVLVNPEIVKRSQEADTIMDGCLSWPGWYGEVERAAWVTVEYQDLEGRRLRLRKATGLLSWALQHEIDHLNGVLFTEHVRDLATLKRYRPDHEQE